MTAVIVVSVWLSAGLALVGWLSYCARGLCDRALTAFDEPEYVLSTPGGPVVLVPLPDDSWEQTLDYIFELEEAAPWAW